MILKVRVMSFTVGLKCPHDSTGCTCRTINLGRISLFTASEYGLFDTVKDVVDADISKANACDSYGYSALHYAAQHGHEKIVAYLITKRANVDAALCGATPLHRAAASNAVECCRLLINAGADVNKRDESFKDLKTPLMKASAAGNVDVVRLLLDTGKMDQTLRDSAGNTAWDLASNDSIKSMLMQVKGSAEKTAMEDLPNNSDNNMKQPMSPQEVHSDVKVQRPSPMEMMRCSKCQEPSLFMCRSLDGTLSCRSCTNTL